MIVIWKMERISLLKVEKDIYFSQMHASTIIIFLVIAVAIFLQFRKNKAKNWDEPEEMFPDNWRRILRQKVQFYKNLSVNDKAIFEYKVHEFLLNTKIKAQDTTLEDVDKLLIAASAVIPTLRFQGWKYYNLDEVVLVPKAFAFAKEDPTKKAHGLVGYGAMEGKMIISKRALHSGFADQTDNKNTAIHEFLHLIDKMDGEIDGIPKVLMENPTVVPWLDMIETKMEEIKKKDSCIRPYGAENKAEFFSVASEYFFEQPEVMKENHPDLYQMLDDLFNRERIKR